MRQNLLTKTMNVLEEFNFDILVYLHSCLDIAAQKKSLIFLIKILENIDGFRKEHADELKKLGFCFNGCPLLVGETTKMYKMKDGVLYERYNIPSITLETFKNSLAGFYPEKIYSKGRMIAEIDGDELRRIRDKKKVSMEELAEEINLTKESIYLYEKERMRVKYEIAKRIENFLNTELIKKPEFFEPVRKIPISRVKADKVRDKLILFDFDVVSFNKLNFDLVASDPKNKVVVREDLARHPEKIVNFSAFFKTFLAFISDKGIGDVPIIKKQELGEIESKKEFLKVLRERSKEYN